VEKKIKVLVVDDSLFVRTILSDMLSADQEIEIVGTAKDGIEAFKQAKRLRPEVITMDLIMPKADGIQALENIMEFDENISVLMLSASDRASADAIMRSLELGAFDFILKPASTSNIEILRLKWEIITKIKAAFRSAGKEILGREEKRVQIPKGVKEYSQKESDQVIAIGSSTGGPVALRHILASMPAELNVPIVIAQHMPKGFTETFADRLNKISNIFVVEASDEERLEKGCAYITPGDHHIEIIGKDEDLKIRLMKGERIRGGRPSADMLFKSIANTAGNNAIGIILTGMGSDGARGLNEIKEAGGFTIAQDEESSLVWSMPRAAIRLGIVDQILPLGKIPEAMLSALEVAA